MLAGGQIGADAGGNGAAGREAINDLAAPRIERQEVSARIPCQQQAAGRGPVRSVAIGPVFGTTSKNTGYDAIGLELVATATKLARSIPVVAIGGITLENASSVIAAGATSVAVIGDLLAEGDPERRVRAFLQSLGV